MMQPLRPGSMRLLLVDDEWHARSALKELCARVSGIDVIGEAGSGSEALAAVDRLRPEIIVLDVDLPDMTGFELLRAAGAQAGSMGVVVTARAEHALTAFAAGAIDYLLKPVSVERFAIAMQRARELTAVRIPLELERPGARADGGTLSTIIGADAGLGARLGGGAGVAPLFLVGEREHRLYPLDPQHLEYIEANGNYVTFHRGTSSYISRDSIKRLELMLGPRGYLRIERSLLVNVRAILYAEPMGRGAFAFTLTSGACIRSTAKYRDSLLRVLPLMPSSSRLQS